MGVRAGSPPVCVCVGRRKGDGENEEKKNVDGYACLSIRGGQGKRQEVAEVAKRES